MRALVIEPKHDRGALAATRALHRAGWTVGVASAERGLAACSRYAAGRHRVPEAQQHVGRFVDAVNAAVAEGAYELVFCGSGDAEMTALSLRRDELGATVPYPPHERVVRAHDKLELARAAHRVGLAVPHTVEASDVELERWAPPYLVKARLHAPLVRDGGPSRIDAKIAGDRRSAATRAAEVRRLGGEPLLQELVAGELMAFIAVADRNSRVVARVQQLADRTWPPRAGVSARACTVPIDESLSARIATLLDDLGWFGIAELQFVLPAGGKPLLIDFNGRFYGSLALSLAAGVNLPAIWAEVAIGREQPPLPLDAAPGVGYQWLEGDLRRALKQRRPTLARDLGGCVRVAASATHSVWSGDDPRPALRAAANVVSRGALRVSRRACGHR